MKDPLLQALTTTATQLLKSLNRLAYIKSSQSEGNRLIKQKRAEHFQRSMSPSSEEDVEPSYSFAKKDGQFWLDPQVDANMDLIQSGKREAPAPAGMGPDSSASVEVRPPAGAPPAPYAASRTAADRRGTSHRF